MDKLFLFLIAAYILIKICFFAGGVFLTAILSRLYRRHNKNNNSDTKIYETKSNNNNHSKLYTRIKYLLEGYSRYVILKTGKIPSHIIRNYIYKHLFCVDMSSKTIIYGGAEIRQPERLIIGEGSIIGDEAKLDARNGIIIGTNVNFSTGVWIWTEQHDVNSPDFGASSKENKQVVCGDRVWLGSRVTVLPGVKIGEGAVVAAGAVVTKDCEPYCIYGGVPAKKIGVRSQDLKYEFSGEHYCFW